MLDIAFSAVFVVRQGERDKSHGQKKKGILASPEPMRPSSTRVREKAGGSLRPSRYLRDNGQSDDARASIRWS